MSLPDGYTPDVLDELVTDRTQADVDSRNEKGTYNASDLNRVSDAARFVHELLGELGYSTPEVSERVWMLNEIPDRSGLAAHHSAVLGQDVINYAIPKVILPDSLTRLTYEGANNIEKFLFQCGRAAQRIPEAYIYSDEIFGGESY